MVKLWLVEQREPVEVAAIDFQLQHGVAIRPMELVRKIEGPMRTLFEDRLQIALAQARRSGEMLGVLFLDVDGFKLVNDTLGHTAGDWFIRVFAKRLREGAEGPNLIARLGGDEFVVVPVTPMSAEEAEAARTLAR